jgi:bifunctional DNase/RNase
VPIIIGISEVVAIKRNLSGVQSERPMTHDLLANVIYALGARLEKVIINKIEANTFYAQLVLKLKDQERIKKVMIDARPSDSIALAVRVEAPIFVEDKVFQSLKKYEGQIF